MVDVKGSGAISLIFPSPTADVRILICLATDASAGASKRETQNLMFEQSLYDIEPPAPPAEEGDLFHGYELKSWDMGPRVYKILAIAAAANILALVIAGTTPLLTMKGCDSPLVSTVCQALDTVVLSAQIFGTEREYVDAAYDKMDLSDADVTFVDVSGEAPPLSYPEGYFALANPEQFSQASIEQQADPFGAASMPFPSGGGSVPYTPPSHSGGSLIDTKPVTPKKNNDLIDGDLPTGIGSGKGEKPGKGKPGASPSPSPDETTAENDKPKVDPSAPVADVTLNKRPFTELGDLINGLRDKNQVNIEAPFLLMATGKLNDGRLNPKSFKITRLDTADPNMADVLKKSIQALDASGYLQYLSAAGIKNVNLVVQQDASNVTAMVESQFDNEVRPKTVQTLLNTLIASKKLAKSGADASPNDKDDLLLLQNASVVPTGKKVVISFTIPQADLQRMIQRKLAEQKAAPKTQQQNNNVSAKATDNTAVKK